MKPHFLLHTPVWCIQTICVVLLQPIGLSRIGFQRMAVGFPTGLLVYWQIFDNWISPEAFSIMSNGSPSERVLRLWRNPTDIARQLDPRKICDITRSIQPVHHWQPSSYGLLADPQWCRPISVVAATTSLWTDTKINCLLAIWVEANIQATLKVTGLVTAQILLSWISDFRNTFKCLNKLLVTFFFSIVTIFDGWWCTVVKVCPTQCHLLPVHMEYTHTTCRIWNNFIKLSQFGSWPSSGSRSCFMALWCVKSSLHDARRTVMTPSHILLMHSGFVKLVLLSVWTVIAVSLCTSVRVSSQ